MILLVIAARLDFVRDVLQKMSGLPKHTATDIAQRLFMEARVMLQKAQVVLVHAEELVVVMLLKLVVFVSDITVGATN